MWLFQQCQFRQPAVSFDTAYQSETEQIAVRIRTGQQSEYGQLTSPNTDSTSISTRSIYKDKNEVQEKVNLGKLSPKSGDTSQPSLLVEVVSIKPLAITGHLKAGNLELIQKATANLVTKAKANGVDYRPSAAVIRQEMVRLRTLGE
jgi:hypothetical protein